VINVFVVLGNITGSVSQTGVFIVVENIVLFLIVWNRLLFGLFVVV
jgi:hypothetical protein